MPYIDVLRKAIESRNPHTDAISRVFFSHKYRAELAATNLLYGLQPPYLLPSVDEIKKTAPDTEWEAILAQAKTAGYAEVEPNFRVSSPPQRARFHARRSTTTAPALPAAAGFTPSPLLAPLAGSSLLTSPVVTAPLPPLNPTLSQQLRTAAIGNDAAKVRSIIELMRSYPKVIAEFNQALTAAELKFSAPLPDDIQQTIHAKDPATGNTVLHDMADAGNVAIVDILLENKADFNVRNHKGETSLMVAAAKGRAGVVSTLDRAGAKDKVRDLQGNTALMHAVLNGHEAEVTVLLENALAKENVEYIQQAFYAALKKFNPKVISLLTAALWPMVVGRSLSIFDTSIPDTKKTPLSFLLTALDVSIPARRLIINDFLIQAKKGLATLPFSDRRFLNSRAGIFNLAAEADGAGFALHHAARLADEFILVNILEYSRQENVRDVEDKPVFLDAETNVVDAEGQSVFFIAASCLHVRQVNAILEAKFISDEEKQFAVKTADKQGRTPLYAVARAVGLAPSEANIAAAKILIPRLIAFGAPLDVKVMEVGERAKCSALELLVRANLVSLIDIFLRCSYAGQMHPRTGAALAEPSQDTLLGALGHAIENRSQALVIMLAPLVKDLSPLLKKAHQHLGLPNAIAKLHDSREQDEKLKAPRDAELRKLIAAQKVSPSDKATPLLAEEKEPNLFIRLQRMIAQERQKGDKANKKLLAEASAVMRFLIAHCREPNSNYGVVEQLRRCIAATNAFFDKDKTAVYVLLDAYYKNLPIVRRELNNTGTQPFCADLNLIAKRELQTQCQEFLGRLQAVDASFWTELGGAYVMPAMVIEAVPEAKAVPLGRTSIGSPPGSPARVVGGDIYGQFDTFLGMGSPPASPVLPARSSAVELGRTWSSRSPAAPAKTGGYPAMLRTVSSPNPSARIPGAQPASPAADVSAPAGDPNDPRIINALRDQGLVC